MVDNYKKKTKKIKFLLTLILTVSLSPSFFFNHIISGLGTPYDLQMSLYMGPAVERMVEPISIIDSWFLVVIARVLFAVSIEGGTEN